MAQPRAKGGAPGGLEVLHHGAITESSRGRRQQQLRMTAYTMHGECYTAACSWRAARIGQRDGSVGW
jgi:hypothetical protein